MKTRNAARRERFWRLFWPGYTRSNAAEIETKIRIAIEIRTRRESRFAWCERDINPRRIVH